MSPTTWYLRRGRIHVETVIDAPLEAIWRHTQTPDLHARWDLRFSAIAYLPRPTMEEPQRFLYTRRLLPGLRVSGMGETVGDRFGADGSATSALVFWSAQRRSLIRRGSGFWRYVPGEGGVRFVTEYDYEVRWGCLGVAIDRLVFRRALAWLTARSFERLRRSLESGRVR